MNKFPGEKKNDVDDVADMRKDQSPIVSPNITTKSKNKIRHPA